MARKLKYVHIFCDEKNLQLEAFNILKELKRSTRAKIVLKSYSRTLIMGLRNRRYKLDFLVVYKSRIQEAIDILVDSRSLKAGNRPKTVVLVDFVNSGAYTEEFLLHRNRLKRAGMRVLYSFNETVVDVVADILKKQEEGMAE